MISVLGPQSSGKSTLLNYLFGCRFSTSTGRCTRGIYAAVMKIDHPNYDKLMILDTEGLQSAEKDDQEFDRKITLYCLAVSHIVIINVKGDLHLPLKKLLEICLVSLHELKKAKVGTPDVFICFNQNPRPEKDPFLQQLRDVTGEILAANPDAKDAAALLNLNADRIQAA